MYKWGVYTHTHANTHILTYFIMSVKSNQHLVFCTCFLFLAYHKFASSIYFVSFNFFPIFVSAAFERLECIWWRLFAIKMKEMVGGCCVCSDERGWSENPLVYCDGTNCTVAVHQACYGIVTVPTGNWYCRKCESQERPTRVRCELCPSKDGALKRTDNQGWAHVVCALYIPEVRFGNVTTMEPILLQLIPQERFNKGILHEFTSILLKMPSKSLRLIDWLNWFGFVNFQCATFVRRIAKALKQQRAHVCSAIDQDVSNSFMSHALKRVVFCAKRPATIWTMSNIAAIVNIITVNWYEFISKRKIKISDYFPSQISIPNKNKKENKTKQETITNGLLLISIDRKKVAMLKRFHHTSQSTIALNRAIHVRHPKKIQNQHH